MASRRSLPIVLVFAVSLLCGFGLIAPAAPVLAADPIVVDNFEAGLPAGHDADGVAVGFNTFQDPNSSVAISTTAMPPAPVPGAGSPNNVLKMDANVVLYAGFTHSFENAAVNQWVSQDWSAYEGISFWLYGNNSGTTLFVDVLDNRNPGSTKDDAERWSVDVKDNFSGWQQIQLPFDSMHRKEIGNGAPSVPPDSLRVVVVVLALSSRSRADASEPVPVAFCSTSKETTFRPRSSSARRSSAPACWRA